MEIIFTSAHIHPILIHFPISFIILGFIAEITALFSKDNKFSLEAAWYLIIIGSLALIPAVMSGIYLTDELSGEAGSLRDLHEKWGFISLVIALFTALLSTFLRMNNLHNTKWEIFIAAFYTLTAIATGITGYFGGILTHNLLANLP